MILKYLNPGEILVKLKISSTEHPNLIASARYLNLSDPGSFNSLMIFFLSSKGKKPIIYILNKLSTFNSQIINFVHQFLAPLSKGATAQEAYYRYIIKSVL